MASGKRTSETGNTGKLVTCREIISMIPDYLEGRLSGHQLEHFLEHIRSCPDCYEELETNYMVGKTIDYLDRKEQSASFDFKPMLENDMEKQEESIIRKRKIRQLQLVILAFTLLLLLFLVLDLTGIFSIGAYFQR